MKMKLELLNAAFDDPRLSEEIKSEIKKEAEIYIFKDESSWQYETDTHVYSLWLDYGKDMNNGFMFEVRLDDLEMFANSLLKSIDMLRRDYKDVIKEKNKNSDSL
jgi:hypothetical protein